MENFLEMDRDQFIHKKSLEIFQKINEIKLNDEDVEISKTSLSGISNTIFKVSIKYKENDSSHSSIKINSIFFKVFGKISTIVDRELETYIIENLAEKGLGPRIYETDIQTYRIEEFIEGFTVLERENMLRKEILPQMYSNFSIINSIKDIEYYLDLIKDTPKTVFFDKLLNIDPKTNFVNFTLIKMKPLAMKSYKEYKAKLQLESKEEIQKWVKNNDLNLFYESIDRIEYILNNLEKVFYETCPEYGALVLSHNDAHPLNVMHNQDMSRVLVFDHEYSSHNFLGFDIANYLIESRFLLTAETYPFYQLFSDKNCEELKDDIYFKIYLDFFEVFEKMNMDKFKGYEHVFDKMKNMDYYLRIMGLSSIMWFVFAVIYFDYDALKSHKTYDYFNFSLDRLSVYDKFVKNLIHS